MKRVAVFCGSSRGLSENYVEDAKNLGRLLSDQGIGMVYGGGKIGLMGVIADVMIEQRSEVIGVIPGLLRHVEVEHKDISQMYVTSKMSNRKVQISKLVDGYIALPGGFGTLDEIFEALTLGQLGIERKPIGLLNTENYFKYLLKQLDHMVEEGFLSQKNREMVLVSESPEDLIYKMQAYEAPEITKIVQKRTGT